MFRARSPRAHLVYNIAPNGAVAGFYLDSNNVFHGFVREGMMAVYFVKFERHYTWPTMLLPAP